MSCLHAIPTLLVFSNAHNKLPTTGFSGCTEVCWEVLGYDSACTAWLPWAHAGGRV
jgi:hypothetical protein